ncbi:hypothetical protein [Mucilaginibacter kameinonensis]|uniref:hypothetical protein n=1 Tax=Mucilaginibacter kameinonensis TaxID=452286 RepID=UPI000EF80249|nr:hypothetical protein [Mucilaginibacter kameinonensis]
MKTICVKDPESGLVRKLRIKPVNNFTFPGWVVLIPDRRNVLIFRKDDQWQIIPNNISALYAEKIGEKLTELIL